MTEAGPVGHCWVESAAGSGFDVDHLPYGVFAMPDEDPRVGVRVGEYLVDLAPVAAASFDAHVGMFEQPTLNEFMATGAHEWARVRSWLQDLFVDAAAEAMVGPHLVPLSEVELRMPFDVADYVDFYASLDHASNVGKIFRPDNPALPAAWRYLPIGYHGRAGTIVPSGADVCRPSGQRRGSDGPTFGPSERLDIEAELGFVVGTPSRIGEPVPVSGFAEHVFGVVGVNDWSARDIQAWEYVPLGPFLGKSFATSVSTWVTPLAALDGARVDLPGQDPAPPGYLTVDQPAGFDIAVEVELCGEVVARPPYSSMYWGPAQMLAHLTVNGASLRTGDLFASGTVSGPEPDERGSLLELSWGGQQPFSAGGRERTFLEDGDEVTLRYTAPSPRGHLTLGEVTGRIVAAHM